MADQADLSSGGASACFKVLRDKTHGRYAVATRFIPAGSVILQEEPLVIAPTEPSKDGCVTCLGCCAVVAASEPCRGCGGPLCGAACRDSPYHRDECAAMQRRRFRLPGRLSPNHYKLLGFLRVLLQQGEKAKKIRSLESHQKKMLADPRVRMQMSLLVEKFMPPLLDYSVEERCWAFGVMEVNCFSYSERNDEEREGVVLMEVGSLLSHSCICNAFGNCYLRPEGATGTAALDGLRKVLVAATDIEPGSQITVNYTHPHMYTERRRAELLPMKFFTCRCRRCEDPSELGLHTHALCCEPCRKAGRLELPVPRAVGDPVTSWRCPRCRATMTSSAESFEMEFDLLEVPLLAAQRRGDVGFLEAFLAKQLYPRGRLHPTHELVMDTLYALTTRLRLPSLQLQDLSATQLNLLSGHCRSYLRAAALSEPGYGLRMARVNLTLNRALLELVKRTAKLPPAALTLARMAEAEECLRKVQVALRNSSDMRSTLLEQEQQTEAARNILVLLGLFGEKSPPAGSAQNDQGDVDTQPSSG